MVVAEILQFKGLAVNLMHGAGGVCGGACLVGVVLLPPVKGSRNVYGHENLADIFAVVAPRLSKPSGKAQIIAETLTLKSSIDRITLVNTGMVFLFLNLGIRNESP